MVNHHADMASLSHSLLYCHIFSSIYFPSFPSPQHSSSQLYGKYRLRGILFSRKRTIANSFGKLKEINLNYDKTASNPSKLFLQELLEKTVRLEQMNENMSLLDGPYAGITLDAFETDLNATISALEKKEDNFRNAKCRLIMIHEDLTHTKQLLEMRNREIVLACSKQKELEEHLLKANNDLASQTNQVEDLKLLISKQDADINDLRCSLTPTEKELNALRNELSQKNKEVDRMRLELESRDCLLRDATMVIESQQAEIEELMIEVRQKEEKLVKLIDASKAEHEMLKAAETNLEKHHLEWSAAMKEIEHLTKQASKNNSNFEVSEDVKRLNSLLSEVRSELISSRQYVALCKSKLMSQSLLENEWREINEGKNLLVSYARSLDNAKLEVKDEQMKLEAARVKTIEFNSQLSIRKSVAQKLQEKFDVDKCCLVKVNAERNFLQMEIEKMELNVRNACETIQIKEKELADVKLEIQNLESMQGPLYSILGEKDRDLQDAQITLEILSNKILELQELLKTKENLSQLADKKGNYMMKMHLNLENVNLKFYKASAMIRRISNLTNQLVSSVSCYDDCTKTINDLQTTQSWQDSKLTVSNFANKEIEALSPRTVIEVKDKEIQLFLASKCCMNVRSLADVDSLLSGERIGSVELPSPEKGVAFLLALTNRLVKDIDKVTQ